MNRENALLEASSNPLFLFENQFAERWFADKYPDVVLSDTPFVER